MKQEENAKAYTELINRLEDVKNAIKKQNYGIAMDILCKPYPEFQITTSIELKESERIRQLLIRFVKYDMPDNYSDDFSKEDCFAWLEKQCEKGTNGDEREIPISEPPLTIKHAKEVMGIKQNDAWSEEDEKQARQIERIVHDDGCTQKLQKQIADWFKSLKDRVQPKQEWSKEDERLFQIIIDILDRENHLGNISRTDLIACVRKLKSLRPQNIWKPSNEQMYNLSEAAHYNCVFFDMEILKGLYDDLKKLKEEDV